MAYRYRYRNRKSIGGALLAGLVLAAVVHGHLGTAAPAVPAAMAPVSASGNVALGQQMAGAYGWGSGAQWNCLDDLWQRESGWSASAVNPQSGATGIPQLLPSAHVIPAGWASAQTQIRWGLGYVRTRYGSPCNAWAHEEADGWY